MSSSRARRRESRQLQLLDRCRRDFIILLRGICFVRVMQFSCRRCSTDEEYRIDQAFPRNSLASVQTKCDGQRVECRNATGLQKLAMAVPETRCRQRFPQFVTGEKGILKNASCHLKLLNRRTLGPARCANVAIAGHGRADPVADESPIAGLSRRMPGVKNYGGSVSNNPLRANPLWARFLGSRSPNALARSRHATYLRG